MQPFTNVMFETFDILDKLYGFDMQAANQHFGASMQERLQLAIGEFYHLVIITMKHKTFQIMYYQTLWEFLHKRIKTIIQVSTKDETRDNLQQIISQSLAVPSEDVEQLTDALEHMV